MQNYLFVLLSKFRIWRKAKVQQNKQPLSRENAYVLSALNKIGSYEDVRNKYYHHVLDLIKDSARNGEMYLLLSFPKYISPMDKEGLVDFLGKLGYNICYIDGRVILISWEYSPNDFNRNIK